MVDTDGLYVPMLASVSTRGTPLLSLLQDLGILVACHLRIQKHRQVKQEQYWFFHGLCIGMVASLLLS